MLKSCLNRESKEHQGIKAFQTKGMIQTSTQQCEKTKYSLENQPEKVECRVLKRE